jgi:hypothetical protein
VNDHYSRYDEDDSSDSKRQQQQHDQHRSAIDSTSSVKGRGVPASNRSTGDYAKATTGNTTNTTAATAGAVVSMQAPGTTYEQRKAARAKQRELEAAQRAQGAPLTV